MTLKQKKFLGRESLRESWVKSTDTPLRFFVQLLFIIEGTLGLVFIAGVKYNLDKTILIWIFLSLVGLGGLALIMVFLLVVFFPKNLVFDKDAHLFERALEYGDDAHIMAYSQLRSVELISPPKQITNQRQEGTINE
ncbi:MAG: hypothetical protein KGK03_04435 [Candidatus Omnitrophica bacterium]|nr:hypothetical protein [Candidatus Omnitrophota bacterium]MDE2222301.1 hypothetical protein [Candidatus Omnitrophota bacterium]